MKSNYETFSEKYAKSLGPMQFLTADEQHMCNNYIRKSDGYLEVLLFGIPEHNIMSNALMLEKNYPGIHQKLLIENPKLLGKKYLEASCPQLEQVEDMIGADQTEWLVMKGLQWGYSNLMGGIGFKSYPASSWIPSFTEKYLMGFLDMKASDVGIYPPEKIEVVSYSNDKYEIEAILGWLEKSGIRLVNKQPTYYW